MSAPFKNDKKSVKQCPGQSSEDLGFEESMQPSFANESLGRIFDEIPSREQSSLNNENGLGNDKNARDNMSKGQPHTSNLLSRESIPTAAKPTASSLVTKSSEVTPKDVDEAALNCDTIGSTTKDLNNSVSHNLREQATNDVKLDEHFGVKIIVNEPTAVNDDLTDGISSGVDAPSTSNYRERFAELASKLDNVELMKAVEYANHSNKIMPHVEILSKQIENWIERFNNPDLPETRSLSLSAPLSDPFSDPFSLSMEEILRRRRERMDRIREREQKKCNPVKCYTDVHEQSRVNGSSEGGREFNDQSVMLGENAKRHIAYCERARSLWKMSAPFKRSKKPVKQVSGQYFEDLDTMQPSFTNESLERIFDEKPSREQSSINSENGLGNDKNARDNMSKGQPHTSSLLSRKSIPTAVNVDLTDGISSGVNAPSTSNPRETFAEVVSDMTIVRPQMEIVAKRIESQLDSFGNPDLGETRSLPLSKPLLVKEPVLSRKESLSLGKEALLLRQEALSLRVGDFVKIRRERMALVREREQTFNPVKCYTDVHEQLRSGNGDVEGVQLRKIEKLMLDVFRANLVVLPTSQEERSAHQKRYFSKLLDTLGERSQGEYDLRDCLPLLKLAATHQSDVLVWDAYFLQWVEDPENRLKFPFNGCVVGGYLHNLHHRSG